MKAPGRIATYVARRPHVTVLVLVLVEAVVVLGVLGQGGRPVIGGDGLQYEQYAANLLDHGVFSNATMSPFFPSVFRTPGYPLFLAFFRLLTPGSFLLIRIAQFMLIAATAMLIGSIARALIGARIALVAVVICATYLPLVWLAVAQLTEVLATFLCVVTVRLLVRSQRRGSLIGYGLIGIAVAVLTLVRPEAGLAIVPIAAGLLWSNRQRAVRDRAIGILALLAAFAAVMAPWTIRNAVVAHRFIPFGAASGQSLYVSAEQYADRISYRLSPSEYAQLYGPRGEFPRISAQAEERVRHAATGGAHSDVALGTRFELADDDAIQHAAFRIFATLTVGQIIRSVPKRLAYLWGTGDYPPQGKSYTAVVHRLAQVQWVLIVVLAVVGLIVGMPVLRSRAWPLLLWPAYLTCVHLVFTVEPRYTLPARPFVILFAAVGAVWLAERLSSHRMAQPTPLSAS